MKIEKKTLAKIFLGVLVCIVVYWLLHETERVRSAYSVVKNLLSPFVIGAGIAFILNVPVRGLERILKGIKNASLRRVVAIVLTLLGVVLILTLVFMLLIPEMINTVESLIPQVYDFIGKAEQSVNNWMEKNQALIDWGTEYTNLKNFDWANLVRRAVEIVGNSVEKIFMGTLSAVGSVLRAVVDFVIAMVFALYCLFQKETLARQGRKLLYAFLHEKWADRIVYILRLTNTTFSNFLSGQCIEVCILGAMFAVTMAIFGMPYIPVVSVLVAVTAFIPVVGAWVGCICGAFLILVSNPMQAVWFVVMFVILQEIENNLIYPRVVGTSIGLSGMWVLLSIALGNQLMGVAGMFLMIPVFSVVYTVIREVTAERLKARSIEPDKLTAQPPELHSKRKIWFGKQKKNSK